MKKALAYIYIFSLAVAAAGIAVYFAVSHASVYVLVCGGVVLVQSLLNMLWGDQHDFNTEFIAAFIGLIAAFFLDLPLLHTVALALCVRLVVISAVSGVLLLRARGKE